ncbi:MAG: sulfotransferase [Pseudomonadota bacterium]
MRLETNIMANNCGLIFVGGPGRSGTSYVARQVASHPYVASFPNVELKLFSEFGGVYDLGRVLTESYSPNRSFAAFKSFEFMASQLLSGGYGEAIGDDREINQIVELGINQFKKSLLENDLLSPISKECYRNIVANLVNEFSKASKLHKPEAIYFLEKTPHILLNPRFLHGFAPQCFCIHVQRDPRAIAVSLREQAWGPDTLEQCAQWVKNYLKAWENQRRIFEEVSLSLISMDIDKIAQDPELHGNQILEFLNLPANSELFSDADPNQLDRWKEKITKEERRYLDAIFFAKSNFRKKQCRDEKSILRNVS